MKQEKGGGRYTQLCVLQGITGTMDELHASLSEHFQPATFLMAHDYVCKDGRRDVLFYVNDEAIPKFCIRRLEVGIRWWEDVIGNRGHGVPKVVTKLYPNTWTHTGDLSDVR